MLKSHVAVLLDESKLKPIPLRATGLLNTESLYSDRSVATTVTSESKTTVNVFHKSGLASTPPSLIVTDSTVGGIGAEGCTSNAPISTDTPEIRTKFSPRWSVVSGSSFVVNGSLSSSTANAMLPASIARLPTNGACVFVGPPLSASGPRRAG